MTSAAQLTSSAASGQPGSGGLAPRGILEILWGPMQGTKALLDPGKSLRVGGSELSDLALPHDRKLAGVHFEIAWDGETCTVRDLQSRDGLTVDGEPVKEAVLSDGAWLRAGQSDFLFHIEGAPPLPPDEDDLDLDDSLFDAPARTRRARLREERAAREEGVEEALATLLAALSKEALYAVLDAARDDRILELLRVASERYRSLYEGIQGETLAEVAPYLVGPFTAESALLRSLVREGWGRRWGIWLTSRAPFRDVRRQLRRFLMVELEDRNEVVYFRFYDPWVWDALSPTWSERQKADLSGGILTWLHVEKEEQRP